jgi:hypothetical protein
MNDLLMPTCIALVKRTFVLAALAPIIPLKVNSGVRDTPQFFEVEWQNDLKKVTG